MVVKVEIYGYDEFCKYIDSIDPKGPSIYFIFSGSKLPNGESWCPDCVQAEPVIEEVLSKLEDDNSIVVTVIVGDRPTWKDSKNPFRTDPRTRLMVIPSMIKWKGVQRLEGMQCQNPALLEMFFDPDED